MKKNLLLALLLSPLLLWSQTQVKRAFLGEDGAVLTESFYSNDPYFMQKQPSNINQMAGFPKKIPAHPNFKNMRNVTLADINGDGSEEILVASSNALRVFKSDGSLLWSKTLTGTPIYPPSVAAMDENGSLGIVQVTGGTPNNGRVYYLDVNGNDKSGFPMTFTNHWILCAPTLADINNDGQKEIIVQTRTSNNLHVIKTDGSVLWTVNLGGIPAITASVGDIDGDGSMDIVTGISDGTLFAFDAEGALKAGYPVPPDDNKLSYQSPLLVDLDGDNHLSIVGASHGDFPKYFIRNYDGTYRSGWPVAVPDNNWTYSPPTIVDLSGNNGFKMFTSRPITDEPAPMLYGFNLDGTMMPNFPIEKPGGLESFISVADITNDGVHDLIFGSNLMVEGQGYIHAYKTDGSGEISGFPLRPTGFTYMNGASLGDVNGDGLLDLVALSYEQSFSATDSAFVNVYELMIPMEQADVLFSTYKGSNDRTGFIPRSGGQTIVYPQPRNLTATLTDMMVQLGWEAPELGDAKKPSKGKGGNPVHGELLGYNIYRNGTLIGNTATGVTTYADGPLNAGVYTYGLTAVYGQPYPGESEQITKQVVVDQTAGFPFIEAWESNNFTANNWTFEPNKGNWFTTNSEGNPPPGAFFTWNPTLLNYSISMISPMINASSAQDKVGLKYDLLLDNYEDTSTEKMKIWIWNGHNNSWVLIDTYENSTSFPWTTFAHDITQYALGTITAVKFEVSGLSTERINWWELDNIEIFEGTYTPHPIISINPTSLTFNVNPGGNQILPMEIKNLGDSPLNWSANIQYLSRSAGSHAFASESNSVLNPLLADRGENSYNWLSLSSYSGTLSPNVSDNLHVIANSVGLNAGTYQANLNFESNDPVTPVKAIPVTFVVGQVGLQETDLNNIKVYPNPSNGNLSIEWVNEVEWIRLINTMGQTVVNMSVKNANIRQLNIGNLHSGAYTLLLVDKNGATFNKIVLVNK